MNVATQIDWLTLTVASVALGVSGLAAWNAWSVARRQAHELGWALLNDLTTGEVAAARNRIGTFMYGQPVSSGKQFEAAMVRDYYTLLWCVERVGAGRRALRVWTAKSASADFLARVQWHAREIATNVSLLHSVFSEYNDKAAWDAFQVSARAVGFEAMTDSELAAEIEARKLVERRAALAEEQSGRGKRRRWLTER